MILFNLLNTSLAGFLSLRRENELEAGSGYRAGVLQVKRLDRKVRALQTSKWRSKTLKCEICSQDFANSEELKGHMERDHTMEERDGAELESPDMIDRPEEAPIVPGKNG
jgi:hypothetical protein